MNTTRKSILVATDLSARCDRAIERALALGRQLQATVDVLHVVATDRGQDARTDDPAMRERVAATLPEAAEAGIVLASGSVPETIARTAQERGCTLLVTGVARYNSLGDYLLGTAVDYVVRTAQVPVLVVKQRVRGPYATLLVASDLSTCSHEALATAGEFFPDATLHLVHAYHVPFEGWLKSEQVANEARDEAQGELDAFLRDPALPESIRARVRARIGYGETAEVMAKTLRETGADLVVLGTHGKSGFSRATMGSNAESILSWAPVDTLMVRERT